MNVLFYDVTYHDILVYGLRSDASKEGKSKYRSFVVAQLNREKMLEYKKKFMLTILCCSTD